MTQAWIAGLGKKLTWFLEKFADCLPRRAARQLLADYVSGQLSDCQRKNAEAMAFKVHRSPRTLQRFLESVEWDETRLRDRTQQIVAQEHADPQAILLVDESGVPKSGSKTAGVARQWCGRTGKVDNAVVAVHTAWVANDFRALLDTDISLPQHWADDLPRRREAHIPDDVEFRTKPRIAQDQIRRALDNGLCPAAVTFDELYGRDSKFLDFLEEQHHAFVGEVPGNFHGWILPPQVLTEAPPNAPQGRGRKKKYPRLSKRPHISEVQNLMTYSPAFRKQEWRGFRVKDTERGPVVWEVKTAPLWRTGADGLPARKCLLIVARNVLNPGEVKYFLANRVPGEDDVTLEWLLWVAFRRWPVEQVFREEKNEIGMDHFEVRGWGCLHRHYYVSALSHLFCARLREEWHQSPKAVVARGDGNVGPAGASAPGARGSGARGSGASASDLLKRSDEAGRVTVEATDETTLPPRKLTLEQIRQATSVWLDSADLPASARRRRYEQELHKMSYHQRRNAQAKKSHTKTRMRRLAELGIDVEGLPSCIPENTS